MVGECRECSYFSSSASSSSAGSGLRGELLRIDARAIRVYEAARGRKTFRKDWPRKTFFFSDRVDVNRGRGTRLARDVNLRA